MNNGHYEGNQYYAVFVKHGSVQVARHDVEVLRLAFKEVIGAFDYDQGRWFITSMSYQARAVADNFSLGEYVTITNNSEVFLTHYEGVQEYMGRAVLRNKADAVGNGYWFKHDDTYFSLESNDD